VWLSVGGGSRLRCAGWIEQNLTGAVDFEPIAAKLHRRQPFAKALGLIKLRIDDHESAREGQIILQLY
jgi:hypothetical protein